MKTITQIALMLFTLITSAQTVTLSQHWTIQPGEHQEISELNLNGYDVVLKNASSLSVDRVYGTGNISTQSNGSGNNQPVLIINDSYGCNVTFEGNQQWTELYMPVECDSTLSTNDPLELNIKSIPIGIPYHVFTIEGKLLLKGITDENTYSYIQRGINVLLMVDGYKLKRLNFKK